MRLLASFAIAAAAVLALCGCTSDETVNAATQAAASDYPTVRCPVYEGAPDCSAETPRDQAQASAR
jgi:hypothetical protein